VLSLSSSSQLFGYQGCPQLHRSFASAEGGHDSVADPSAAEINPLLQTPARRAAGAPVDAAAGVARAGSTRGRDSKMAFAVLRSIPISPKKLAKWTDVMRRRHYEDAVLQCRMSPKKAARICLKVQVPVSLPSLGFQSPYWVQLPCWILPVV
jgi:large subunit ribosomal protein L22